MRAQRVTRVVDMLPAQGRVVLWLACNHKLSLTERQLVLLSEHERKALTAPDAWAMCPHCPDPTPEQTQRTKSATQLWREAGEP